MAYETINIMLKKSKPKAVLLTKESPFQAYCANKLYMSNIIDCVILEEGKSIEHENLPYYFLKNPLIFFKKLILLISLFNYNPFKVTGYFYAHIMSRSLTNNRLFHNKRILGSANISFNDGLQVELVTSVNSEKCIKLLKERKSEVVFIFGTSLLKEKILKLENKKFINMHWGWSPDYRSEGIISALAIGGYRDLGITIHFCDLGADSGEIILRDRPVLDSKDNVYSIGLKLTVIGTELFIKTYKNYYSGNLQSFKQDLSKGVNYTSIYMKRNYWMRLKTKKVLEQL